MTERATRGAADLDARACGIAERIPASEHRAAVVDSLERMVQRGEHWSRGRFLDHMEAYAAGVAWRKDGRGTRPW